MILKICNSMIIDKFYILVIRPFLCLFLSSFLSFQTFIRNSIIGAEDVAQTVARSPGMRGATGFNPQYHIKIK